MGCCSANKFHRAYITIARANQELESKNKHLVQLTKSIRAVEHQIDHFDVEQRFEEADLKERELIHLKQDKHSLICKIKRLKKTIQDLRNALSTNRELIIQNQLNQQRINILEETRNLLITRRRDQENLEEQNNVNRSYLYDDEINEDQQVYRRPRNQASNVFPIANND